MPESVFQRSIHKLCSALSSNPNMTMYPVADPETVEGKCKGKTKRSGETVFACP